MTNSGLADYALADLADDIETDEQVESLGQSLGLKRSHVNRYLATNRLTGRVTCKGTRDMLYDWRQKTAPRNQATTLKKALVDSGLVMLADRYLTRTSLPDSKFII